MQKQTLRRRVAAWFTGREPLLEQEAEAGDVAAPRTAFVLLGGGARGAAQAGAVSVLLDRGIVPDFIVGISAGSWNGAYLALGPTPERALQLEALWISTTSHDIIGPSRWTMALNAVANRASLYDSEGMRRLAERHLAALTFADTQVPLRIVAADLVSGQPKLFADGPLLPAVLASSAVPGIFPPVMRDGEVLVDGGIAEWAGCLAALESGATRVFLVSCGGVLVRDPKLNSFRRILERSLELSSRSNFALTVFALEGAGMEVIPIYPEIAAGSALNFDHAPTLVKAGRVAAKHALEKWDAQRADLSSSLGEEVREAGSLPPLDASAS